MKMSLYGRRNVVMVFPMKLRSVLTLDSVAARKNDIFFITEERYFIFSMIKRCWKELDFEELFEQHSPVVFTYTESLLPCKYYKSFQFIISFSHCLSSLITMSLRYPSN